MTGVGKTGLQKNSYK